VGLCDSFLPKRTTMELDSLLHTRSRVERVPFFSDALDFLGGKEREDIMAGMRSPSSPTHDTGRSSDHHPARSPMRGTGTPTRRTPVSSPGGDSSPPPRPMLHRMSTRYSVVDVDQLKRGSWLDGTVPHVRDGLPVFIDGMRRVLRPLHEFEDRRLHDISTRTRMLTSEVKLMHDLYVKEDGMLFSHTVFSFAFHLLLCRAELKDTMVDDVYRMRYFVYQMIKKQSNSVETLRKLSQTSMFLLF
jgi:hypothetical protein